MADGPKIHLFEIQGSTDPEPEKHWRGNRRVLVIAESLLQAQDVVIARFPDIEIHQAIQRDGVGYQAASLMITSQAVAALGGHTVLSPGATVAQTDPFQPTIVPRPPLAETLLQGEAEILTVLPSEETP